MRSEKATQGILRSLSPALLLGAHLCRWGWELLWQFCPPNPTAHTIFNLQKQEKKKEEMREIDCESEARIFNSSPRYMPARLENSQA